MCCGTIQAWARTVFFSNRAPLLKEPAWDSVDPVLIWNAIERGLSAGSGRPVPCRPLLDEGVLALLKRPGLQGITEDSDGDDGLPGVEVELEENFSFSTAGLRLGYRGESIDAIGKKR